MKRALQLSLLFVSLLCTCASAQAQGIEFFHGEWSEALAKAKAEDKLIFVDAYAEWCGPCKRMAANVFPLEDVGSFFNENFINVKMDMEKAESKEFRRNHSVRAYPTLLFINAKNEVVHKSVGGKQAQSLIEEGGNALNKMDDVEDLAEQWESGDQNPKLALRYIRAMVRQGQNHAKVANDYLRAQKDLTTPENLDILLVAATNADSRIFDLLVKNQAAVVARSGQKAFDAQIKKAVMATKDKGLEYKDAKLIKTAVDKYASVDGDAAKALALQADFELAAQGQDAKAFTKATKKYLTKGATGDAAQLANIYAVATTSSFIKDEKVMDLAVAAQVASAELDAEGAYRKYYRLAEFLLKNDKKEEAYTYAQLAMNSLDHLKAGKKKQTERAINALLGRIESAR
ncbi:thioredoxin domain-containing protein [Lewinella sp. 4G2]|uniref:thioredoxin family protein n=1 Tax=Lewinella sp. 4G2 TaxID=1803372 RepID=UPI0007B4F15E|nr:thioredoxin domain-containing protein [Lewinella sp. 4G2]OAV43459.1 hypothetical protein A3850_002640 [Lewinella sp. 4G2]